MEAPTSTGRAPFSAFSEAAEILDHDILPVDAIGRPVGIAMTARVEGDGAIAGAAERFAGALPGVAGLSTAVLQQDERTIGGPPAVAGQHHAAEPRPAVHGVWRTGQTFSCAHARVG